MLHHQVIFNFIRNRWGILLYLAAFTKYLSLYKKGPHYIWMCEAISDALQDDKWAWQKVSQTSYASVRHGRFRQQIRCNIARHLSYTHLVLALFSITSYSVTTACTNGAIRFSRIYLKWSFLFFCRENESSQSDCGEAGTFSPKVSGGRALYDDGPPNDPNGYFRHPLTAAETAISSEASALAYEYSKLPALDASGMKIGETNDYKDIIR